MRVLVTGAAGRVAGLLLPYLAERHRLRTTDLRGGCELTGDLAEPGFAAEAMGGADAVVHLAADPRPGAGWADLYRPNVEAALAVLSAARAAGVRRVVLAGSLHAAQQHLYGGSFPIDPSWPPAPCCPYGATKAFAEAAGRMTAYRDDISVICLRLGAVAERLPAREAASSWLAAEDLRLLVAGALSCGVRHGVYHGVSANTRARWGIADAVADLGYRPVRDSEPYLAGAPSLPGYGPCPPRA
ncbi:NAD(P)-dependent oxidoreductase [Spongiactinospora sp. TRM90649]|uniref:NAD-dependent epimerase/dehydratase family protein n=1 Tax=Spongiactinospora sp. TRM90649 TaxID=3031114 RepID=UPI0023F6C600|nr:NAD(P)-dependent oxidoreductase [Spongiactinospora sp. TRM90649]MDF5759138.1 NAD(P)-dependent oxidoreductase [Spongiactinospora sp. TRM90649]